MPDAVDLSTQSYGKGGVRVLRVFRDGARHHVWDLEVSIHLEGDFATSYTQGDNTLVVPTDTMKNTVYVLARRDPGATPEALALTLARHFRSSFAQVRSATVTIDSVPWHRVDGGSGPHDHAFELGTAERARCVATSEDDSADTLHGGLHGLVLMKTTASGFSGFHHGPFTTLRDTDDRVLRSRITARWRYDVAAHDFDGLRSAIRAALVEGFVADFSPSVQQTLYAMGERALAACPAIDELHLALPNLHCLHVDLSPFDEENPNEVFLPVDEPYGMIEATLRRG